MVTPAGADFVITSNTQRIDVDGHRQLFSPYTGLTDFVVIDEYGYQINMYS